MRGWLNTKSSHGAIAGVLLVYALFLTSILARYDYNFSGLIGIGERNRAYRPERLPSGLIVFKESDGYDGQYFYYIAREPFPSADGFSDPFRYQRIGYPLLVHLFSLGREPLIPYMMPIVNLLAVTVGCGYLIKLLHGYHLSPWYAVLYGLNPGQILAIQNDLADPVYAAAAIGGLYHWERKHLIRLTLLFTFAMLTRESTILFLLPVLAMELWKRRWGAVAALSTPPLIFFSYQVFLWWQTGELGLSSSSRNLALPFFGLGQVLAGFPWRGGLDALARWGSVAAVAVLMLGILLVATAKLRRGYDVYTGGAFCHGIFSLMANQIVWEAYGSAGRVFAGAFPLLLLSFGARREGYSKYLFALCAILVILTLLRPWIISPRVDYFVTP